MAVFSTIERFIPRTATFPVLFSFAAEVPVARFVSFRETAHRPRQTMLLPPRRHSSGIGDRE